MKNSALQLLKFNIEYWNSDSVGESIAEFRQKLQTAQDLNTNIAPWLALVLLLDELNGIPKMKHLVSRQHEDLNAMAQPGNLTMTQFYGITAKLIQYVNQEDISIQDSD